MTEQIMHSKSTGKWPVIVAAICIVAGCASWIAQLSMGLLVGSGMSNTFAWGLMIAIFAFLVGFGAGSQFVASYIVLAKRKDLMPYVKTAQAIALAGAIGAGVAILIDLGNPFHIFSMILGPQPISPLTWDMIALSAFIVIAIINVIALARDSKLIKLWMTLGVISAFALQLVEGLLFALMESRVWWHSVIMPVDFIVVAMVCGLAIATIACALSRDCYNPAALHDLSFLLTVAIIVHLVLALIDLAIVWFSNNAADAAAMAALGSVWYLYVLELGLPLAAVLVLLLGKKDPAKSMLWGGGLTIVGIFFHRIMLLYPALGAPTLFVTLSNEPSPAWPLPASTGLYNHTGNAFEIAQGYLPNFFEWASVLLPLGIALAVFLFVMWFEGKMATRPAEPAAAVAEEAPIVEEAAIVEAHESQDGDSIQVDEIIEAVVVDDAEQAGDKGVHASS